MSAFFGHNNHNSHVLLPCASAQGIYHDPGCYHNGEFIPLVDHHHRHHHHHLLSASIFDGDTAAPIPAPPAAMARPQMSVDTANIASAWNQPRDPVFAGSPYGQPVSFQFSIDPRSLEDFASTLDDTSQSSLLQLRTNSSPRSQASQASQASTLASPPPPDSPPVKKRRGCKPRALTGGVPSAIHRAHAHAHGAGHSSDHAVGLRRLRRQSTASLPAAVPQPMASASPSNHDDGLGAAHDDARQSQLERNRIAAAKCRTKRTAAESKLTSYERQVEDINSSLKSTHNELRQQVLNLKDIIHSHANCDCPLIKTFLANEAKRYVESGADAEYNDAAVPAEGPSESTAA